MRKQKGFSLIELLIVGSIILIIAAIAIPNLMRARMAANDSSAAASERSIVTADEGAITAGVVIHEELAPAISNLSVSLAHSWIVNDQVILAESHLGKAANSDNAPIDCKHFRNRRDSCKSGTNRNR